MLPGGMQLLKATREIVGAERVETRAKRQRERRAAARARRALELRALAHALPGDARAALPESLRVLYGSREEATRRLDSFFERVQQVDAYLHSFKFGDCDFCEEGWFGTQDSKPVGQESHMNYRMAAAADRNMLEGGGMRGPVACGKRRNHRVA